MFSNCSKAPTDQLYKCNRAPLIMWSALCIAIVFRALFLRSGWPMDTNVEFMCETISESPPSRHIRGLHAHVINKTRSCHSSPMAKDAAEHRRMTTLQSLNPQRARACHPATIPANNIRFDGPGDTTAGPYHPASELLSGSLTEEGRIMHCVCLPVCLSAST